MAKKSTNKKLEVDAKEFEKQVPHIKITQKTMRISKDFPPYLTTCRDHNFFNVCARGLL